MIAFEKNLTLFLPTLFIFFETEQDLYQANYRIRDYNSYTFVDPRDKNLTKTSLARIQN